MSSRRFSNLIVVSGPSGAGKTTVLTRVLSELKDIRFSISHTTRAPRPGERDGVEYHFVTRREFERLISEGAFLEWAEVHGELYGTARAEYDRAMQEGVDLLLDIDVKGADQVVQKFDDAVTVFVIPPSYTDLERRLRGRGPDDEASFQRRLAVAGEEMSHFRKYQYAIVNVDLEASVEGLKTVIRASRLRTSRVAETAEKILSTFLTRKER
jgi:guanylate kinase